MEHRDSAQDFTMNGFFLNIINGLFFAFSTTLLFIGENLSSITAGLSLFFLVILNARKVIVEVGVMVKLAKGQKKKVRTKRTPPPQ